MLQQLMLELLPVLCPRLPVVRVRLLPLAGQAKPTSREVTFKLACWLAVALPTGCLGGL